MKTKKSMSAMMKVLLIALTAIFLTGVNVKCNSR